MNHFWIKKFSEAPTILDKTISEFQKPILKHLKRKVINKFVYKTTSLSVAFRNIFYGQQIGFSFIFGRDLWKF